MIRYQTDIAEITPTKLQGFFVGWPKPPSPETHLRLLESSQLIELALEQTGNVIGYLTVLSDGVLFAFISSLEVLPAYQGCGIGQELMRRMLIRLQAVYAIDLICDPDVQPFYAKVGMHPASGMLIRKYERQAGE